LPSLKFESCAEDWAFCFAPDMLASLFALEKS
jgi:hypothetical protein